MSQMCHEETSLIAKAAKRRSRPKAVLNSNLPIVVHSVVICGSRSIFTHKKAPDNAGAFEALISAQISTWQRPGRPS